MFNFSLSLVTGQRWFFKLQKKTKYSIILLDSLYVIYAVIFEDKNWHKYVNIYFNTLNEDFFFDRRA